MNEGEFSVYAFYPDGTHDGPEVRYVDVDTAQEKFLDLIQRPASKLGIIRRVIITDGGDLLCAEWKFSEGITWPKPEQK